MRCTIRVRTGTEGGWYQCWAARFLIIAFMGGGFLKRHDIDDSKQRCCNDVFSYRFDDEF